MNSWGSPFAHGGSCTSPRSVPSSIQPTEVSTHDNPTQWSTTNGMKMKISAEEWQEQQLLSVLLYCHEFQTFTLHSNIEMIFLHLTQVDVVGVEEEVRQVEELWDQLSDIPHVVPGGWLPLLLDIIKHALRDVKASLCRDETQRSHTDVWNFATGLLIINVLCLIYCSHLNIILFPYVCRKCICCHLKGAFHLLIKFHNLQWKSLERQCNLN